jgi:hypothetical protein
MKVGDLVCIKYTLKLYENPIKGTSSGIFYRGKVGVIIDVISSSGYVKIVHPNGVGWAWVNDVEVV